jgi:hypothetical protein
MRKLLIILLSAAASSIAMGFASEVSAADFKAIKYYGQDYSIILTGPIVDGDESKFKNLAVSELKKGHFIYEVRLFSHGGSTNTALNIGRQIRLLGSVASAPRRVDGQAICSYKGFQIANSDNGSSCDCASACSLIWTGGNGRVGAVVGLHRPRFEDWSFKKIDVAQAEAQYKIVEEDIKKYLSEMGAPDWAFHRMFSTSSADIYYLNASELNAFENDNSALDELWVAKCGKIPWGHGTVFTNPAVATWADCYFSVINSYLTKPHKAYLERYDDQPPSFSSSAASSLVLRQDHGPVDPLFKDMYSAAGAH